MFLDENSKIAIHNTTLGSYWCWPDREFTQFLYEMVVLFSWREAQKSPERWMIYEAR